MTILSEITDELTIEEFLTLSLDEIKEKKETVGLPFKSAEELVNVAESLYKKSYDISFNLTEALRKLVILSLPIGFSDLRSMKLHQSNMEQKIYELNSYIANIAQECILPIKGKS